MNAEQFRQRWTATGEELQSYPLQRLLDLGIAPDTAEFLATAGLPESAAPLLEFCDTSEDVKTGVCRLDALYPFLPEEFDHYAVIGHCNEGDPIVINNTTGKIEYLETENDFKTVSFNTSITAMAGCILAYRNFVLQVEEEHGEDAYVNAEYSEAELQGLQQALEQADPELMQKQGFWHDELEAEKEMWQESRES